MNCAAGSPVTPWIPSISWGTSPRSTGRSTGSEVWAALGGLAFGLALSGALRWGRRHRKTRSVLLALGFNLAAAGLVGALLAAGTQPGGLGQAWPSWLWPAGIAAGVATLAFRFPRSLGVPLLVVMVGGSWLVAQALVGFRPLDPVFQAPLVQPLTDRETVTVFALRADFLDPPEGLSFVPTLYRLRSGSSDPAEWWWSWAASRGWARSVGAALPDKPLKWGLYRLALTDGSPVWNLEVPELTVPDAIVPEELHP